MYEYCSVCGKQLLETEAQVKIRVYPKGTLPRTNGYFYEQYCDHCWKVHIKPKLHILKQLGMVFEEFDIPDIEALPIKIRQ